MMLGVKHVLVVNLNWQTHAQKDKAIMVIKKKDKAMIMMIWCCSQSCISSKSEYTRTRVRKEKEGWGYDSDNMMLEYHVLVVNLTLSGILTNFLHPGKNISVVFNFY